MNKFLSKIEKYDTVVIFGASDIGKLMYKYISSYCEEHDKLLCYADNSFKKWTDDGSVSKPSEIVSSQQNIVWIICSDLHSSSMISDLRKLGIDNSHIITDLPEEIISKRQELKAKLRTTPQKHLKQIDVDLAHHCNLNCAGCTSFSPLVSEPIFADYSVFEKDMKRLSHLLDSRLDTLHLLGGEPLLNPNIVDFICCSRKNFPNTNVTIITNGLLLPKMKRDFWDTCKDNNILISATKYPLDIDWDGIADLAARNDVAFELFGISVVKTSHNYAVDPKGLNNPLESFSNCTMANYCARLRNGKISTCSPILNVEFFNKYFASNLKVCSEDYIDIYEAQSEREILEFIATPVPFCRYCDVKNRTFDAKWHVSKRDINEWITQE